MAKTPKEEAIASLATMEEQFKALRTLSADDRDALWRSAEDVREGRYATDDQVKAIFNRYRPYSFASPKRRAQR